MKCIHFVVILDYARRVVSLLKSGRQSTFTRKKFRAAAVSKCLGWYDIDVRRTNISKYLFRWDFVPSHQRLSYRITMTANLIDCFNTHVHLYLFMQCRPGCLCTVSGALLLKSRFNIIFCLIDILSFSWRQVSIK